MRDTRIIVPAFSRRSIGRAIRRGQLPKQRIRYERCPHYMGKPIDSKRAPAQPDRTFFFPPYEPPLVLNPDFFLSFDHYTQLCSLCGGNHSTETIDIGGGMTAKTCPNVIQPEPKFYQVHDFYGKSLDDLLELQRQAEILSGVACWRDGFPTLQDLDYKVDQDEKMPVGDHVHNARGEGGSCTLCRLRLR